jgi:DNA-binding transcriptional regulator GbsR (MarR family)
MKNAKDHPSLTPLMETYILHWGEMGTRWGVNRTVSQIHALLYLVRTPLNAEQISQVLNVARSNVSNSIKELQSWDLVKVSSKLGDRRDQFSVKGDTWQMLLTVIEGRKKREIDPIMSMLRQCEIDMQYDEVTPKVVKEQISEMLNFMDTLTAWYEQMRSLPSATLITLLKMGTKVTKFLPLKK